MQSIRIQTEQIEEHTLHTKAAKSSQSRGRTKPEREGDIRTCYQRDRDRIIHSKSFRRLKHKTQVFLAPKGDHYRTRLTHVLEVSQIARTIARALRLNEDLTEAVALGHDLGHTPFGHAGEDVLNRIHPGGFKHYEQSLRVVEHLEKQGRGLNLTHEVKDGILKHSKGKGIVIPDSKANRAGTLEGQIVRISDLIAYLNHDLDDAQMASVIKKNEIPQDILKVLGDTHSKRIDTMVKDLVFSTLKTGLQSISISEEVSGAMENLRAFLYERVYESDATKREFKKAEKILKDLYDYYLQHTGEIAKDLPSDANTHTLACDFIAGMTDRFALVTYERLFMPEQWEYF